MARSHWLDGLPPIPADVLPRVVKRMPTGLTVSPRVLYREWVRSDGELQCYAVYEIDPRDCAPAESAFEEHFEVQARNAEAQREGDLIRFEMTECARDRTRRREMRNG